MEFTSFTFQGATIHCPVSQRSKVEELLSLMDKSFTVSRADYARITRYNTPGCSRLHITSALIPLVARIEE